MILLSLSCDTLVPLLLSSYCDSISCAPLSHYPFYSPHIFLLLSSDPLITFCWLFADIFETLLLPSRDCIVILLCFSFCLPVMFLRLYCDPNLPSDSKVTLLVRNLFSHQEIFFSRKTYEFSKQISQSSTYMQKVPLLTTAWPSAARTRKQLCRPCVRATGQDMASPCQGQLVISGARSIRRELPRRLLTCAGWFITM